MTDEQINIAIAEACGWYLASPKEVKYPDQYPNGAWKHPSRGKWLFRVEDRGKVAGGFPCYTTDLNAMHEAEKTDDVGRSLNYYAHLLSVAGRHSITATARQRAEAFLRTLSRWEES